MAHTPSEIDWYLANKCDHAHCPEGCEKPQPGLVTGLMLCMRCLVLEERVSEMVPCTPEVCE